jgi:capsular exopolysaccharide synthesis family protein
MSSTLSTPPSPDFDAQPPVDVVATFARFLATIRRRKHIIISSILFHALLGVVYYTFATRKFASTAELIIIQQKQDHLSTVGDHETSEDTMATHQKLISSPVVIKNAIKQLPAKYRVDLVGKPVHEWVETITANLGARVTRKTNFIDVSYRSKHPEAAAAVVRAVINSYLRFVEEKHRGTAGETLQSLLQKGNELETKLAEKQNELQRFGQQVGYLAANANDKVTEPTIQRALRLNDALLDSQERRLELQATLVSVTNAINRGEDVNQYLVGLEETVGRQVILSSLGMSSEDLNVIEDQQKQMLNAQTELNSLSKFYGPNHPRIAELQSRIAGIQQYLQSYRDGVSQRVAGSNGGQMGPVIYRMLEQSVRQAQQKEQQLASSFEEARQEAARHSGDVVQLRMLEREVTRLEAQYDLLFEKISTVDMRQEQAPIQATVVREPVPDLVPISPQLRFVIFGCFASGIIVGTVIIYVQDVLDDRFSSPEELTAQLGVPVLTMVRKLDPLPGTGMETVHTHAMPNAVESEAFRTLRTALSLTGSACERLLICSSEPGDGKTTITANLSTAFAQAGKRTLVIDADLRRPGFTSLLNLKGVPGVAEIITSELPPAEMAPQLVQHTEADGLDVLPVGLRRPNPAELLSSQAFVELLAWADSVYDRVIVDCPPVLAVSDAQIVGQLVDGAILVVRPEKNHRRAVIRAVECFRSSGCHVLGVVANALSADSQSYGYGGYGYGYGYGYTYGHDENEEVAEHEYEAPQPKAQGSETIVPRRASRPQSQESIRPRRAA